MKRRNGDAVLSQRVPGAVMHEMPADLRTALIANTTALAAWHDITRWHVTSSSAGCSTPNRPRHENIASAARKKNSKTVNAGPAAGPDANTAIATARSEPDICSSAARDDPPLLNSALLARPRGGF
jgi:hypothetical protein